MKIKFAALLLTAFFVSGCVNTSMVEYHQPQAGEIHPPFQRRHQFFKSGQVALAGPGQQQFISFHRGHPRLFFVCIFITRGAPAFFPPLDSISTTMVSYPQSNIHPKCDNEDKGLCLCFQRAGGWCKPAARFFPHHF